MMPHDIERVFGRGRLQMATGEHVEVFREAASPGDRRCYTKRFLATGDADFRQWTDREWRMLARLIGHGVRCVPDVVQFEGRGQGGVRQVQTYDAGITVDQWATLLPVSRGTLVRRHVFEDCAHWWALAQHCLKALEEIHALGLVHLDIKADNICVPYTPDEFDPAAADARVRVAFERLALIDFAFSIVSGEPLATALPIGWQKDYDYQSPRLLRALEAGLAGDVSLTQELDWRCDLYSLAAMLRRYLPDEAWAREEGARSGWTPRRYEDARALIYRLRDAHDRELPPWRPHRALLDVASEHLADSDLDASLGSGWSLARGVAPPAADRLATPLTRIAPPRHTAPPAVRYAPGAAVAAPPTVFRTTRVRVVATPGALAPDPAALRVGSTARRTRRAALVAGAIVAVAAVAAATMLGDRAAPEATRAAASMATSSESATTPSVAADTPPEATPQAEPAPAITAAVADPENDGAGAPTIATPMLDAVPAAPAVAANDAAPAVGAAAPPMADAPVGDAAVASNTSPPASAVTPPPAAAPTATVAPRPAPKRDAHTKSGKSSVPSRQAARLLARSSAPAPAPHRGGPPPAATIPNRSVPSPMLASARSAQASTSAAARAPAPPVQVAAVTQVKAAASSASLVPAENVASVPHVAAPAGVTTPASPPASAAEPGASVRSAEPVTNAAVTAPTTSPRSVDPVRREQYVARDPWRLALRDLMTAMGVTEQRAAPVEERSIAPGRARESARAPAPTRAVEPVAPPTVSAEVRPGEASPSFTPPIARAEAPTIVRNDEGARTATFPANVSARAITRYDAGEDLRAEGQRILTDVLPRAAAQAQGDLASVLSIAGGAESTGQNRAVYEAALRMQSESSYVPGAGSVGRARQLYTDARQAFAAGRDNEAADLMVRALAANPRDPDVAGFLAYLNLRNDPGTARRLALHALASSGPGRVQRDDDWNTLAVANALTGRETDATRAFMVELALTRNVDRTCRAALGAYGTYGERLRAPVQALLYRVRLQGRDFTPAACTWPAYRTAAR